MTHYHQAMACPRCNSRTLNAVDTDAGPTLDFCSSCGGVWFDKGEIEAFLSWKSAPSRLERSLDLTHCPLCETPTLTGFSFGADGPLLDGCTTCEGIWCDQGEVVAIRRTVPKARMAEVEGKMIPLMAVSERTGAVIDWKWVCIGAVLMLMGMGLSSIPINIWIASDAVMDAPNRTSPDVLIAAGGALAFGGSGFIVGWRSSGYTLLEPAIVAIPVALMFPFFFTKTITTSELLVASTMAFFGTMAAALIGERWSE